MSAVSRIEASNAAPRATDRVRRTVASPLRFDGACPNRALPALQADVDARLGAGACALGSDGGVAFAKDLYADDIIGLLRDAWASRPAAGERGTPDGDVYAMLQATILVFDAAAVQKHGYSGGVPQDERAHSQRLDASSAQVAAAAAAALERARGVLRDHAGAAAAPLHN